MDPGILAGSPDFASRSDLREEEAIAVLLHAARVGILDMSWNVLCPGCGGVLDAGATLKAVQQDTYECVLCAAGYRPTLDEMVEVVFTVSPRVRRIGAHDPHSLPIREYYRQVLWSTGIALPEEGFEELMTRPHLLRPAYLRVVGKYLADVQKGCDGSGVDYVRMLTSRPLVAALGEYLVRRLQTGRR